MDEGTPDMSRKYYSRSTSQPQVASAGSDSNLALPRSASFTPETEFQKDLNSSAQVKKLFFYQDNDMSF